MGEGSMHIQCKKFLDEEWMRKINGTSPIKNPTGVLALAGKGDVPTAINMAREYYNKPGNPHVGGGSLHIVLDDGNITNNDILFCIKWAKERNDQDGVALGEYLLTLSKTQRKKLVAQYEKYSTS